MEFKPMPSCGEVTTQHPDGYYLEEIGLLKQITIAGPMPHTPRQINDEFPGFEIKEVGVLPPSPDLHPKEAAIIRGRGFFFVQLIKKEEPCSKS